ncbi:flagellar motor switch protein FliN [Aeromicrobium massiliense]|uniref:flagellar motor switch protein FliN n=1 Tax=Aeromicrobium massiliense TaxID=1464554 RepID=UPI0005786A6E|nr:flagellar motor switch protein FliN [Aeromicrobium massiliense]
MTDIVETQVTESAAVAAAAALPSVDALTAGPAERPSPVLVSAFAAAVVADLGGAGGRIGLLVAPGLVAALADTPLGELDLTAVVQPAIDAAAEQLGRSAAGARVVDLGAIDAEMGETYIASVIADSAPVAALLVSDTAAAPAPVAAPEAPFVGTAPTSTPAGLVDGPRPARGIEMLHGVIMDVTVELGRTQMSVRDLLALTPGTVLELDRAAGSPADLLVNGRLIARGEVVVVDEDFGLRVTEILDDNAGA